MRLIHRFLYSSSSEKDNNRGNREISRDKHTSCTTLYITFKTIVIQHSFVFSFFCSFVFCVIMQIVSRSSREASFLLIGNIAEEA